MSKMSIQFFATTEDILKFICDMKNNNYCVKAMIISPAFKLFDIDSNINKEQICKMDRVIISKSIIVTEDDFRNFMLMQDNNIVIEIGKSTESSLSESRMWINSENEIDSDLKKIYNAFKRKMIKGAWGLAPDSDDKYYYKNQMYTVDAKAAYDKGVKMLAYAGSTIFKLDSIM